MFLVFQLSSTREQNTSLLIIDTCNHTYSVRKCGNRQYIVTLWGTNMSVDVKAAQYLQ